MFRLGINKILTQNQPCLPIVSLAARLRPTINSQLYNDSNYYGSYDVKKFHTNSQLVAKINLYKTFNVTGTKTILRSLNTETEPEILDIESKNQIIDEEDSIPENLSKISIASLERAFSDFENRCQLMERVKQNEFVKIFNKYTRTVNSLEKENKLNEDVKGNLSFIATTLIMSCGRLMIGVNEKNRELLAGNLWHFLKEKQIPVNTPIYNSLIRVMNDNNTDYDPEKILEEMNSISLKPDAITYQRLIHKYCLLGDLTKATSLLEKMKESGMELSEATFASLIIGYGKSENPTQVLEMFELMRSNGIEPGSKTYSAAVTAFAEQIKSEKPGAEKELKSMYEIIKQDETQFQIQDILDMFEALGPIKTNETASAIIECFIHTPNRRFNDQYRVLNSLCKNNLHEEASQLYWRTKPNLSTIKKGNAGLFYLEILLNLDNISCEHIIKECRKLTEAYNTKAFDFVLYKTAQQGRLDLVKDCVRSIIEYEGQVRHVYYFPLLAQAKSDEDFIQVLLEAKMKERDLLETFILWVWPRFNGDFNKLYQLNKEKLNFDNKVLVTSYLNYLIYERRVDDAVKFVTEASESFVEELKPKSSPKDDPNNRGNPRPSNIRSDILSLLIEQVIYTTKDPKLVKKALDLYCSSDYKVSPNTIRVIVKGFIDKEDYQTALETFFEMAKQYKAAPCKAELMKYCLEKQDSASLEKIMDLSTGIHGESNALFDLAVVCLECNRVKQANKIFQSSILRINPDRVYMTARNLARRSSLDALENFVHLTKDMFDVDQELLYSLLIEKFDQEGDYKRVLKFWNKMQEVDFQPSKKILVMIADVLEKNGLEIPFQKPKLNLE